MSLFSTYKNFKLNHWGILAIFWTFMAVMISSQLYSNSLKNGLDPSWIDLFMAQLPIWFLWMLASPSILFIVNKYPFDLENWKKPIFYYLIFGFFLLMILSNLTLFYMFSVYGYLDLNTATLEQYSPYLFSRFSNDLVIYLLVLMIIVIVRSYTLRKNNQLKLVLEKLKNDQLKNQLTEAQLQALKLQLNPHFLFNTLNTISSLTLIGESSSSISVTTKLGDFLRRTLDYEEHQLVTLEKELEFFDLYIDIESIRFKDRLEIHKKIDKGCLNEKVPNLILQPLIENAVKYGITKKSNASLIELDIKISEGMLRIELFNEGPLMEHTEIKEGIGLSNIKKRLQKLYNQNYLLEVLNIPERNGVISILHFPIINTTSKQIDA